MRSDSGEYRIDLELSKDGYLPAGLLDARRLKCLKDARALLRLDEVSRDLRARTSQDVHALQVGEAQLAARREASGRASAARSPADGVLAGIRAVRRAGGTVLIFLIRRSL